MNLGLSLCGGGMRGYVEACFLDILSEQGLVSPRLLDTFSVIGGTSTGGIQTLAYGMGKTPREARTFFEEWGVKIFSNSHGKRVTLAQKAIDFLSGSPFYGRVNLDKALGSVLGTLTLGELPHSDIFVTTFEHTGGCQQLDARKGDLSCVEAALMTSAAPFYFNTYKNQTGSYDDGFLYCNNPSLLVLERLQEMGSELGLLSLGTGVKAPQEHPLSPHGTTNEMIEFCYLDQARLLTHMVEGQNTLIQEACKRLCDSDRYLHLDIDLSDLQDPAMDNASPEFLLSIERKCRDVIDHQEGRIRTLFT
jgi:predicted acylesterase/phospholipase RssA